MRSRSGVREQPQGTRRASNVDRTRWCGSFSERARPACRAAVAAAERAACARPCRLRRRRLCAPLLHRARLSRGTRQRSGRCSGTRHTPFTADRRRVARAGDRAASRHSPAHLFRPEPGSAALAPASGSATDVRSSDRERPAPAAASRPSRSRSSSRHSAGSPQGFARPSVDDRSASSRRCSERRPRCARPRVRARAGTGPCARAAGRSQAPGARTDSSSQVSSMRSRNRSGTTCRRRGAGT
jgi:hypothetical protein